MTDLVTAILVFCGIALWIWAPNGVYYIFARYAGGLIMVLFALAIQVRAWR
jgi:hypothetical protein